MWLLGGMQADLAIELVLKNCAEHNAFN